MKNNGVNTKQTCTTCRFNNGNCWVGTYYAERGLNKSCISGELWEPNNEKIKVMKNTRNTPELRLQIYKAMLKFIERQTNINDGVYENGFCLAYKSALDVDTMAYHVNNKFISMRSTCKELIKYEPVTYTNYWFDNTACGTRRRIKILNDVILELESKLVNETKLSKLMRTLRITNDIWKR